jgi:hypothetical protein
MSYQIAHFKDCTNELELNPMSDQWQCTMIDQSVIAIGPYPGKNMKRFLIGY